MKFLLTVLAALLLGCASSQADPAYYFAANGSDSKPCTQTLPCLTIAKARSLSSLPGDSINFRGGDTFTGCLSITPTNVPSGGLPPVQSRCTPMAPAAQLSRTTVLAIKPGW